MSLSKKNSRRNKILIATAAGISIGIVSYLLWNRRKKSVKIDEQEIKWTDLNDSQIDDRQQVKISVPKLPDKCEFIPHEDLKQILKMHSQSQSESDCLTIDVRDTQIDHSGGHITGSINISEKIFYDQIPQLMKKYHNKSKVVIYCMYGARRSIKCTEFYAKAVSELIANYNKETKTSHYFLYHVKDANDSSIHMLYGGEYGWMDPTVVKKKIDIDFCDDELIENLSQQKILVLKGGFFTFFNSSFEDAKDEAIISGFDESKYEQLELRGVFDKKMWYHKQEYFARARWTELKEAKKSLNFKLNSSQKDYHENV